MAHRTSTSPPPPDGGRKPGAQPAPQRRRLRSRQAHGALGAVGRGSGGWGQSGAGAWGRKEGQRVPHQPGVSPPHRPAQHQYFQRQVCCRAVCGQRTDQEQPGNRGGACNPPCQTPALPPSLVPFLDPSARAPPASQVQREEGDLTAPLGAAGMLGPGPWGWPQTQDSCVAPLPH